MHVSFVTEEQTSHESDDQYMENVDVEWDVLSSEQADRVRNLLAESNLAFKVNEDDYGLTDAIHHEIKLLDDTPFRFADRKIPYHLIAEVKKILEEWLRAGAIRESKSPFASQIALAKKKSGAIRVCIDFRFLNKRTVIDSYPLPRMEDCINSLKNSKWFSALDLSLIHI